MKYLRFIILVTLFVAGCGDNPTKILNKGGVIEADKNYTFYNVSITNISATDKYSTADFCVSGGCFKFGYEGDLSEFENYQKVNITAQGGELKSISDVFFITEYCYLIAGVMFGHYNSIFIARYIFLPVISVIILLMVLSIFVKEEKNETEV